MFRSNPTKRANAIPYRFVLCVTSLITQSLNLIQFSTCSGVIHTRCVSVLSSSHPLPTIHLGSFSFCLSSQSDIFAASFRRDFAVGLNLLIAAYISLL